MKMLKKFLSLLLAVIMVVGMFPITALAVGKVAFTATASADTVTVGQDITVAVSAGSAAENVMGFQFTLTYNKDVLEYKSLEIKNSLFGTQDFGTANAGKVTAIYEDATQQGVTFAAGEIAVITFTAKAAAASTDIGFAIDEFYDKDDHDIEQTAAGDSFEVAAAPTNSAPKLKDGISATAASQLKVNETYSVDLSTIFEDADGDTLTYKVAVNGAGASATVKDYSLTPSAVGTTTLVFTANDGKTDGATYTVTVDCVETLYTLNFWSIPSSGTYNANYGSSATKDNVPYLLDSGNNRIDFTTVRETQSKAYVVALKAGTYTYVYHNDDGETTATGSFEITAAGGDTQNVYLKEINFRFAYNNVPSDYDCNATVTMTDPDEKSVSGIRTEEKDNQNPDGTEGFIYSFVVEAKGTDYKYTYNVSFDDKGLLLEKSSDDLSYAASKSSQRVTVTIEPYPSTDTVTFKILKGAGMGVYRKTSGHYAEFYEYEPTDIDTDSDLKYDIYTYAIPKKSATNLHTVVGGSEGDSSYIKTVDIWSTLDKKEYTIEPEVLNNATKRDCIYATTFGAEHTLLSETVEADMFLNVDDSNYLVLDMSSETPTFNLRAYRVNQAQYGFTANYFIEPDFNYEILSGDSVEIVSGEENGCKPGNEYATLVPAKEGITVIRVKYDAMMLRQQGSGSDEYAYFNATDSLNERIIVVNVVNGSTASVETGITEREYDTIYYTEKTKLPNGREASGSDYAEYTFTPETGSSVSVHAPLNGAAWNDSWTAYIKNSDGSFTVHLSEGENIIKVSKDGKDAYYVVSAKGITVIIENVTNPGKSIRVGDTVTVSFDTLNLPNKKMAGIYNPGFPDTTWTFYNVDSTKASQEGILDAAKVKEGIVRNSGSQYIVASSLCNGITFKVLETGDLSLTGGQIHSEHFGSPLNAHRLIDGTGVKPNNEASNNTANADFSSLPDVTIAVVSNAVPTRKTGVSATEEKTVLANIAYTLNLTTIFEDEEGDALTYKVAVNGANPVTAKASYSYSPAAAGTTTLVFTANDGTADSTDTYTVTLTVQAVSSEWKGTGTKEDPYLIETADDMLRLSALCAGGDVFSGKFFKITENITLPANWQPIGTTSKRFAGNIDGDNKLLTVPAGEKALMGATLGATLKNLNIYGTQINGNGVVAIYTTGASGTAITIDNVTLKAGTTTTGSGFVGGYASGSYPVVIRNSTVEAGVIIGDGTKSNIGSFGGDFNGTIIGCKSSATVKGINFVGGISGSKSQTMGDYFIADCIFDGTVIATGDNVGGISGSGYAGTSFGLASAPNTPCVSIINCAVSGSISGASNVGGILGAEAGVKECWNNGTGYIQNNLFTGTVSATGENKGGIIGYMSSLNMMNVISGNYFVNTCGATAGIGAAEVETPESSGTFGTGWNKYTLNGAKYGRTDDPMGAGADKLAKRVTTTELTDGTVLALLNSGKNSSGNWTAGASAPTFVLPTAKHLIKVYCTALSTSGGVSQEVNGESVLSGKTLTLLYSDGTTDTVSATDASVTKDYTLTKDLIGKYIPASITYGGHQIVFNLNVKNTKPSIKDGATSKVTATIAVNNTYAAADLKTIFEDKDGDTIVSYKITKKAPSDKSAVTLETAYATSTYSFVPTEVGETVLKFYANDGTENSSAYYQVTLTVVEGPVISGITAAKTDAVSGLAGTVSFTAGDKGTVYYLVKDADATAPTAAELKAGGTAKTISAAGAASVPVTFSKEKAQKLYAVLFTDDGYGAVVSADVAKVITVSVGIYDYNAKTPVSASGKIFENTAMTVADGSKATALLKRLFELEPTLGGVVTASDYGSYLSKIGSLEGNWQVGYQPKNGVFDDYSNYGIDTVTLSDGDKISADWSQSQGNIDGDSNKWWSDVGAVYGGYPVITSFKIDGNAAVITTEGKAGTAASPYEILVKADSSTGRTAEIVTNFGGHYRVISPDLTTAQNYTSPVSFYVSNLGGSAKTYYKATVDAAAPEITSAVFAQTANEAAKGVITVVATDDTGVVSVKVTGADYEKTLTAAPYTFDITKAGSYSVTVTDKAGRTATKVVEVSFVTVTGITIDEKDGLSTELNDGVLNLSTGSFELKAVMTPANEIFTVKWSSNMPSVATVDQNGKVTVVGAGIAIINATAGGKSATVLVEVKKNGETTVNDAANLTDIAEAILPTAEKAQAEAIAAAVNNMSDSEKAKLSDSFIKDLDDAMVKDHTVEVVIEATADSAVAETDRIGTEGHSAVGLVTAAGTKDLDGKTIKLKIAQVAAETGMKYTFELELDLNNEEVKLASPVIITIKMPAGYVHDSAYRVKHTLESGKVEWLAVTYDKTANTITFRADRFSTFSVGKIPVSTGTSGTVHVIGGTNNSTAEENPNTGYEAPAELVFASVMLLAAAAASLGKKRR